MNVCGISPIPILVTFLCCAALFVYFNLRLAEIKNAVEKQNKVLTSFITNVQQDIRGGGNTMYNQCGLGASINNESCLASAEAMKVVQKIEVSDDEYGSGSDSDSESDSGSEIGSEIGSDGESDGEHEEQPHGMINLSEIVMDGDEPHVSVSVLAFEVLSSSGDADDINTNSNSSISEITDETLSLELTTLNENGVTTETVHSYESMKVDDLRATVTSQNLASREDARKLKKPELISLLKK